MTYPHENSNAGQLLLGHGRQINWGRVLKQTYKQQNKHTNNKTNTKQDKHTNNKTNIQTKQTYKQQNKQKQQNTNNHNSTFDL